MPQVRSGMFYSFSVKSSEEVWNANFKKLKGMKKSKSEVRICSWLLKQTPNTGNCEKKAFLKGEKLEFYQKAENVESVAAAADQKQ